MSDNEKVNPENIPTKSEFKEMISGLKEVINSSPKIGKHRVLRSDFVDKGYYYNEKDAKELIPYLDEIATDKEDREIRYEDYPQWGPNTIWAKFNQAIKYVVDHLDTPEGKYKKLRANLRISKGDLGVEIKYEENANPNGTWILHRVKDSKKMLENYKTRVYKFMESSEEGDELDIKEGISLTEDEVAQMKELFSESPIFMAFVSSTRIKIVHSKQEVEE